ncbi:MAG: hypothetical protein HYS17_11990 [Micavibrio aeruginosavorus]|uniref:Uncharacterized protein n=1 Tax=Micavibrio aeruginosavorus TaxID=349221 RepID=A0A7T5R259_9BACT|nr:MAG: hypothetical protein HYS17_11990 [Micavibrio aeruginosavorus]
MSDPDSPQTPPPATESIEALLLLQTCTLDGIFHRFLEHMEINRYSEDRIHVALRAQAQCQATARTLKSWRRQAEEKP